MQKTIRSFIGLGLLMLIITCLSQATTLAQVLAYGREPVQEVDYSKEESLKPLSQVLSILGEKYNVNFNYNSKLVKGKLVKVNTIKDQKELDDLLTSLLKPLHLEFEKIEEKQYVIYELREQLKEMKSKSPPSSSDIKSNSENWGNISAKALDFSKINFTVSGKITSETGEGLPGVNVVLKSTTTGVITNADGVYSIALPDGNGTLVFSYVGYLTKEVTVEGRSTIDVQMLPNVEALSEVVVVGYGTQRKSDLTGSVAAVPTAELKKIATNDITQMLQGRIAGVSVTSDGQPGASPRVRIRGIASFGTNGTSTDPLYVVDGVPLASGIRDFNPNDIESMQVLKDASAGAIYGSRAANGVIIITTKRGAKDRPLSIELSSYVGVQQVAKKIPVANRVGYQLLNNEMRANNPTGPLPPVPGNDPNSPDFINNIDTDWQKEAFKNGYIQDHTLGFSGGSKTSMYNLSLDYFKNTGTLAGNVPNYERYSARINSETQKGLFKIGESFYLVRSDENPLWHHADAFGGADLNEILRAIPTMPLHDPARKGGYGGTDAVIHNSISLNVPGMTSLVQNKVQVTRMFADVYGEANLIKNEKNSLTYRLNLAYDYTVIHENRFVPQYDLGYFFINTNARASSLLRQLTTGLVENTLNYELNLGNHSLKLLAGQTYQTFGRYDLSGTTSQLREPYVPTLANGNGTKTVNEYIENATLFSLLGRVNYSFKDKYLVTANLRSDGSSRISPKNRTQIFPSVALAWKINNEEFINMPAFVSELKLRASWGELGNQGVPAYSFTRTINQNIPYAFGGNSVLGGASTFVIDPNLKWEKRTTRNIGLDASLLNGMFDFTVEYYSNSATDILVSAPIPASTGSLPTGTGGSASILTNAGAMDNSGFEFSFTYRKQAGDFSFEISPNAYTLKNKVTKLNNDQAFLLGAGARTEVGREIGSHYGWVYEGIFQTADEVKEHAFQSGSTAPGDVKFKDLDGNNVIDDKDRQFLGKALPNVYYGLNATAKYKGFDLTLFTSGSGGNKINNSLYRGLMSGNSYNNYHEDLFNRWTPTHTNTDVPRMVLLDPNNNGRDSNRPGWLESGTYLRINTLSLGYTVPQSALSFIKGFASARIYITAQNLYTFSSYKGYNPDFGADALNPGFDGGTTTSSYPKPRTLMAGVQLRF